MNITDTLQTPNTPPTYVPPPEPRVCVVCSQSDADFITWRGYVCGEHALAWNEAPEARRVRGYESPEAANTAFDDFVRRLHAEALHGSDDTTPAPADTTNQEE